MKRPPITVEITTADAPSLDVDQWVRDLVAMLMDVEGVKPVAASPSARLG